MARSGREKTNATNASRTDTILTDLSSSATRIESNLEELSRLAKRKFSLASGSFGFIGAILLAYLTSHVSQQADLASLRADVQAARQLQAEATRAKAIAESRATAAERALENLKELDPIRRRYGPIIEAYREVDLDRTKVDHIELGDCLSGGNCYFASMAIATLDDGKDYLAVQFGISDAALNRESSTADLVTIPLEAGCINRTDVANAAMIYGVERQDRYSAVVGFAVRTFQDQETRLHDQRAWNSIHRGATSCEYETNAVPKAMRDELSELFRKGWAQRRAAIIGGTPFKFAIP